MIELIHYSCIQCTFGNIANFANLSYVYIVEFEKQNIEVIPDSWLIEDGKACLWPKDGRHFVEEAIKNKLNPER